MSQRDLREKIKNISRIGDVVMNACQYIIRDHINSTRSSDCMVPTVRLCILRALDCSVYSLCYIVYTVYEKTGL